MNKLFSLAMLLDAGYFIVQAVRFLIEMIRAPRGSFTDAILTAESDRETCDRNSPMARDRRFARARGNPLE
jgi:hypothetical protein